VRRTYAKQIVHAACATDPRLEVALATPSVFTRHASRSCDRR
jgi:hypothetical protein